MYGLYLIFLKFHEDFTPILTNVDISEPLPQGLVKSSSIRSIRSAEGMAADS